MKITFGLSVKLSLIASSMALGSVAYAAEWVNSEGMLKPGMTIQSISANANKNSYTSNPALTNRAWGMQGAWLNFQLSDSADVVVTMSSAATNAPGFTVYRTDNAFVADPSLSGLADKDGTEGAIHAFNQVGQPGKPGLVWATDNGVADSLEGNTLENGLVETLGYVNGSMTSYVNFWNDDVNSGAHDVSIDNKYESGVYGSILHDSGPDGMTNYSTLTLVNLQAGYYTIFLGGTNTDGEDTPIDVKVSALPISVADCVLTHHEHSDMVEFPQGGLNSKTLKTEETAYYFRHYATTENYLGISTIDNHLYSLDNVGVLTDLGDITAMATEAGCK